MGGSYVGNAATFLIETLFGLYILIVMLRFLLQWARADFYNPVSQFILKATQPPLTPLRRIIPGFAGLDLAAIVFMFTLKFVELWLVTGPLMTGGMEQLIHGAMEAARDRAVELGHEFGQDLDPEKANN